jgi:2-polyprenyl-6-methoxyphenol hydroxylase-like FAD-dependent oxidoreductase
MTVIEDRGAKKTYELESRHVIACDGARSRVRETLKIKSDGESTCKKIRLASSYII